MSLRHSENHGQKVVLITGPSGAGRSTTLHAFEDIGFETIDNLPISMIERLIDGPPLTRPMALGIDVRNRDFSTGALSDTIDLLSNRDDLRLETLYLECHPDVLLKRFSETRRRHPLARAENPEIGIERESGLMVTVRERADILLDTSQLTPHDLRAEISRLFKNADSQRLAISVNSFSYKRGAPLGIDMMFDCRFLRNPYWEETLRDLNGQHADVQNYIRQDVRYAEFFNRVSELIHMLLPACSDEGKVHLSIGFGCTGGQHRSVAMAEHVSRALTDAGWKVTVRHREIERREHSAIQDRSKTA